jgi:hypothetical protein
VEKIKNISSNLYFNKNRVYNFRMETKCICPICESINDPAQAMCCSCRQDLRSAPLSDFIMFVENSPENRRKDLSFQFGVLKHKIRISFDAIKYLVQKNDYQRVSIVYNYYLTQIDRERSSSGYYLQMFSERIFNSYYGLLQLDAQVYFYLLRTYLVKISDTIASAIEDQKTKGLLTVEDQKNKLLETINEIIEEIDELPVKEIYDLKSIVPPLPLSVNLYFDGRSR